MIKTIYFKEFNDNLKELREKDSSLLPENKTAEDFASANHFVKSACIPSFSGPYFRKFGPGKL